jgi:thiamine pyrophosphate-dependent acetolactate synthase large subunit-like protein
MADRNVRAGDADRERVAEALRRHFAEGRLDPDEFDQRLSAAFRAKTMGELGDLVADLPQDVVGYALPVPVRDPAPVRRRAPASAQVAAWVTASAVCWTIWLIILVVGGGQAQGVWPLWVSGPWGAVLLARWINGWRT